MLAYDHITKHYPLRSKNYNLYLLGFTLNFIIRIKGIQPLRSGSLCLALLRSSAFSVAVTTAEKESANAASASP